MLLKDKNVVAPKTPKHAWLLPEFPGSLSASFPGVEVPSAQVFFSSSLSVVWAERVTRRKEAEATEELQSE